MDHVPAHWSGPAGRSKRAQVVVTDRSHGDLSVDQPSTVLEARRRGVVDAPWSWLHQVHGADVAEVHHPGDGAGREADALWTAATEAPIAVQVADCAPVALIGDAGAVAVAHAGWRGLVAGVLESGVAALQANGATSVIAVLGPCIGPAHYEFGNDDLDVVAARFGDDVRSLTATGRPALDMPTTVERALSDVGVALVSRLGGCTATEGDVRWSHRACGDRERQAMVVWMEEMT